MRKMVIGMVGTVLLSCAAYGQNRPSGPQACEHLAQLELPGAKILLAQTVAAGAFMPPSYSTARPVVDASFYKTLGAFCRFMAVAMPSADFSIKIQIGRAAWRGKG